MWLCVSQGGSRRSTALGYTHCMSRGHIMCLANRALRCGSSWTIGPKLTKIRNTNEITRADMRNLTERDGTRALPCFCAVEYAGRLMCFVGPARLEHRFHRSRSQCYWQGKTEDYIFGGPGRPREYLNALLTEPGRAVAHHVTNGWAKPGRPAGSMLTPDPPPKFVHDHYISCPAYND